MAEVDLSKVVFDEATGELVFEGTIDGRRFEGIIMEVSSIPDKATFGKWLEAWTKENADSLVGAPERVEELEGPYTTAERGG